MMMQVATLMCKAEFMQQIQNCCSSQQFCTWALVTDFRVNNLLMPDSMIDMASSWFSCLLF
jgi:hypothetical protein